MTSRIKKGENVQKLRGIVNQNSFLSIESVGYNYCHLSFFSKFIGDFHHLVRIVEVLLICKSLLLKVLNCKDLRRFYLSFFEISLAG